jgi:basic membrane protein A
VPERGGVVLTQLRDREDLGSEREPDVRVRELGAQPLAAGEHDRLVVEGHGRKRVDRMPARVGGHRRVEVARDEPEVGRRELPLARAAARVAAGLELLEVCQLAHVDLDGEVATDRLLERLTGLEEAAGKGPVPAERLAGPLPEQHLEPRRPHLEDGRERDVRRGSMAGAGRRGRLGQRFQTISRKLRNPVFRTLVLGAAAASLTLVAGCGGGDDEAATTAAQTTAEKPIRVGLVTDIGQLNDRGFNALAFKGLQQAERELGVQGRVIESKSASDYIPNLTSFARQGYDLLIGVGFAQGDAVDAVATQFPDTRFVIIDVDQSFLKHKPKNVVGLLFREQEVGYLAGYLAGLQAKREPGPDVISSVGGMKEPPVDRFIAGYQAGARKADPGAKLLNGYSQDWDDLAKCKELALNQIAAGSTIVFQVAGGCGLGALDAAKERDVWGIGVDADQSFLGPHVLTSAQKKVDQAVFLTIKSVVDGSWQGGRNAVFGLKEDGVGLGKVSPKVPKEDLAKVDEIKEQIVAGEVGTIPTRVS